MKVEFNGSAQPRLRTQARNRPNSFQTWSQFLYRLSTILDVEGTAIITPLYNDYDELLGYYPILPSQCEVREFEGVPYLRYQFATGKVGAIEWERVGILTRHQYRSDFFGTDNRALIPTMDLINIERQGITEAVKNGATYRFMAKMTNFAKPTDLAKEQKNFSEMAFKSENKGMLLFPSTYEDIKQINSQPYKVDAQEQEYIRTNIYNYFGVNEDILQNKAYGNQWSAFYEGAVEPFAIQLSEVLTAMTYTNQEQNTGNFIIVTANRLQYMTVQEKLNVTTQLTDRGILNRDEAREIWQLAPLPNGMGKEYVIRGEYKNAEEVQSDNTAGEQSKED